MAVHTLNTVQISGLSAAGFKRLTEQIGHLGLDVTTTGNGCNVTGQNLAGSLSHDASTEILTLQIQQVPPEATPGYFVGRLYDEILTIARS
ncbi:hypothetical protein QTI66_01880 [Variovorax sp. J22R133]|uniref:hypothetical protein n=1 Tax=Variovorax brevis TaxID=3053503 RepID=UPI0025770BA3|nr:hypothetical protein [Variovorax sp. J22R133]MDM0110875.1 hypothetical protein [Variovorax sp. J22R133]